jgi:GxxExxY protein
MDIGRLNELSGEIVTAAMRVHSALGPGLLEGAYTACLRYELASRGLAIKTQVPLPITYRGVNIDVAYRLDIVVAGAIIVELKAVSRLLPLHEAQLISYLRLSGHKLGLLFNFHEPHLRDGLKRFVNDL